MERSAELMRRVHENLHLLVPRGRAPEVVRLARGTTQRLTV